MVNCPASNHYPHYIVLQGHESHNAMQKPCNTIKNTGLLFYLINANYYFLSARLSNQTDEYVFINLLEPGFFLILAHPVYKM